MFMRSLGTLASEGSVDVADWTLGDDETIHCGEISTQQFASDALRGKPVKILVVINVRGEWRA